MTNRFTRRFRVRHCELDALGHVSHVAIVQFLQEAAIEASTALGFSPDSYRELGTAWVVRRLSIRYFAPICYGDEVDVATWISAMRGVRSIREYDLSRVRDGARLARARTEWVYVDVTTGQPTRCPDDWLEAFPRADKAEELGVRLDSPRPIENAHRYSSRRRVQFHELDAAQHVNHSMYLRWAGEAHFDALHAAGHALGVRRQKGWMVLQAGHEVQYFAPALDKDDIEVVSWICEMGEAHGAWTHEVYHADTHKLLARDYSLVAFVDLEGKPTAPPPQAIEEVLRGATG